MLPNNTMRRDNQGRALNQGNQLYMRAGQIILFILKTSWLKHLLGKEVKQQFRTFPSLEATKQKQNQKQGLCLVR